MLKLKQKKNKTNVAAAASISSLYFSQLPSITGQGRFINQAKFKYDNLLKLLLNFTSFYN